MNEAREAVAVFLRDALPDYARETVLLTGDEPLIDWTALAEFWPMLSTGERALCRLAGNLLDVAFIANYSATAFTFVDLLGQVDRETRVKVLVCLNAIVAEMG